MDSEFDEAKRDLVTKNHYQDNDQSGQMRVQQFLHLSYHAYPCRFSSVWGMKVLTDIMKWARVVKGLEKLIQKQLVNTTII